MPEAVIIDCLRTAVGKAPRGALRNARPDDLAATVIRALLTRYPQATEGAGIDDVIIGCAMPEGEAGNNMARQSLLRAGLPESVPGMTINRFCSSGLQAIAQAADRIRSGGADILIAGGAESMSKTPFGGLKPAPNPWFVDNWPEVYMSMGLTAERVQRKYSVSREDADAFALRSHQNAIAAQQQGKFDQEIVSVDVETATPAGSQKTVFHRDEGPRADSTMEALAKLKPVFPAAGTVTAGNSSQTSDGAAAALIMSDTKARELGLKPKARFVSYATAGVAPEIMGIGPVPATQKVLKRAGLSLNDIDIIELNEAFAAQSLSVIQDLGIDLNKMNIDGGALALGHPLGASGARITGKAATLLKREGKQFALATMCIGGGQGIATILEAV